MPAPPTTAIIGMSHVTALARAATPAEAGAIRFINLRATPELVEMKTARLAPGFWQGPDPELVCLCLGGNLHNLICLMESSDPFALGDAAQGAVAGGEGRHFVPQDMMRAYIAQRLAQVFALAAAIHARFPAARFLHLSSPPPVRQGPVLTEAEKAAGGAKAMTQYLVFDVNPPPLRLAVFALQNALYADCAARLGADFLPPPQGALTPEGLLADGFWDDDPTHGNAAWGRLMLDQITAAARGGPGGLAA